MQEYSWAYHKVLHSTELDIYTFKLNIRLGQECRFQSSVVKHVVMRPNVEAPVKQKNLRSNQDYVQPIDSIDLFW
jgi:hypothetical protein